MGVEDSVPQDALDVEGVETLSAFRGEFHSCLTRRADTLFALTDAVLCTDGPVRSLVGLSLAPEHRRGHGALYDAVDCGRLDIGRLRRALDRLPLPRAADGRWCWPYSFVAALEPGRTSWTALLDAVRLGPADDATAVTADQLRAVVGRLVAAGHWCDGDPNVLVVVDAGYDVTRLAFVLADLPVELLGRIRSDRVLRLPTPPRRPGVNGRPPRHGPEFALDRPETWPEPQHTTTTETSRYGRATAASWDRLHPRLTHRTSWIDHTGDLPVIQRRQPNLAVRGHDRRRVGEAEQRLLVHCSGTSPASAAMCRS